MNENNTQPSNALSADQTQASSQKLDYAHSKTSESPVSPKPPVIQVVGVMSALILVGVVILQVDRLEIPTRPVPTEVEVIASAIFDFILVVVAVACLWPTKPNS